MSSKTSTRATPLELRPENFYTPIETSGILGVSRETVYDRIASGELEGLRLFGESRLTRVTGESIIKVIDDAKAAAAAEREAARKARADTATAARSRLVGVG